MAPHRPRKDSATSLPRSQAPARPVANPQQPTSQQQMSQPWIMAPLQVGDLQGRTSSQYALVLPPIMGPPPPMFSQSAVAHQSLMPPPARMPPPLLMPPPAPARSFLNDRRTRAPVAPMAVPSSSSHGRAQDPATRVQKRPHHSGDGSQSRPRQQRISAPVHPLSLHVTKEDAAKHGWTVARSMTFTLQEMRIHNSVSDIKRSLWESCDMGAYSPASSTIFTDPPYSFVPKVIPRRTYLGNGGSVLEPCIPDPQFMEDQEEQRRKELDMAIRHFDRPLFCDDTYPEERIGLMTVLETYAFDQCELKMTSKYPPIEPWPISRMAERGDEEPVWSGPGWSLWLEPWHRPTTAPRQAPAATGQRITVTRAQNASQPRPYTGNTGQSITVTRSQKPRRKQ